jgi:SAM-dependent methyltransferase
MSPSPPQTAATPYSGTDVLEVLTEARNYNAYLLEQVLAGAAGARRVLDFGAGIGTFAREVRSHGHDVTCVELDAGQRARLVEQGLPAHADLSGVPDASFDYVYTLNVLEHIPDHAAAARELHRVLRPGGRLYAYVPAFQLLYSSFDRKVGHVRRYRRPELVSVLQGAGFTVERARYADSLGFLAALAFRAVAPDTGEVDRRAVVTFDRFVFPLSRRLDAVLGAVAGKNLAVLARR